MKRIIPILLVAFTLGGCIKEDANCPVMYVSFPMEDPYMEGDYDSRVGGDVLLYVFKDNLLTHKELIPYASIAHGAEYAIRKTRRLVGDDIKLVAWAVPAGSDIEIHNGNVHPEYELGCNFDEQCLMHILPEQGSEDRYCAPHNHERYIGTRLNLIEKSNHDSHNVVIMHPAPGRITVNINDPADYLGSTPNKPHIIVDGTMSNMNLRKKGYGRQVVVRTALKETSTRASGRNTHSTGIFGVLPSGPTQTLSVQIMNGSERLQTLVVHTDDNLHESIESGELLEFDYTLGASKFTVRVGDWTENIYIVDGM